jgi:hypothetical protein
MKKAGVFGGLALIICMMAPNLYTLELWNGFTTDMTEEDVIARAKEVLQAEWREGRNDVLFGPFGLSHSLYDKNMPNLVSFDGESTVWISGKRLMRFSPLPAYDQDKVTSYFGNISFDFHNNFLCGVNVEWSVESKVLLQRATAQFGKPETFLEDEAYANSRYTWYRWKTGDKQIYFKNGRRMMCFVYMKPHLEYRAEQEKIKKDTESSITF